MSLDLAAGLSPVPIRSDIGLHFLGELFPSLRPHRRNFRVLHAIFGGRFVLSCFPMRPYTLRNYSQFWRRLRAVAVLRPTLGTVDAVYKRMPVCARAMQTQIRQARLSEPVAAALRETLGAEGWAFAIGETDTLCDAESGHA